MAMEAGYQAATADSLVYDSTDSPPFEFSDYTQRVVVSTMYLVASVFGTIGNSLVILAVLLSKRVRTTTNAFVVDLSTADLLTCLVIPLDAAVMLSKAGLPFGEWVCGVVTIVQNTALGCSIFTLTFIALNRLLLIIRPTTTYRVVYTPKKMVVWLAVTWLLPLLITVLPPILNVGGFGYNPNYHHCGSNTSHPGSEVYNIITAGVIYPILLVTIIVCYVRIWRHLHRHSNRLDSSSDDPDESTANPDLRMSHLVGSIDRVRQQPSRGFSRTGRSSFINRRQNSITKNMFYVVCAFMLCLTPYAISLFFADSLARPYTFAFFLFNTCVNPLIYATKHHDFKNIFRRIFRRQWDKIPEPSDFLKAIRGSKCCGRGDLSA